MKEGSTFLNTKVKYREKTGYFFKEPDTLDLKVYLAETKGQYTPQTLPRKNKVKGYGLTRY